MPYIIQIGELIGAAILGGWISRIMTIRSRVRQENAGAGKAEAEAKASQIENIESLVEKVYKPTIETLTREVQELREKVDRLEDDKDVLGEKVDNLEQENKKLRNENDQLRDAIREIQPDLVPSKRSVNAKRQAADQPRAVNGQFTKKEEA